MKVFKMCPALPLSPRVLYLKRKLALYKTVNFQCCKNSPRLYRSWDYLCEISLDFWDALNEIDRTCILVFQDMTEARTVHTRHEFAPLCWIQWRKVWTWKVGTFSSPSNASAEIIIIIIIIVIVIINWGVFLVVCVFRFYVLFISQIGAVLGNCLSSSQP